MPALKDRLKYYRNYDGRKGKVKVEEDITEKEGVLEVKKNNFTKRVRPKYPAPPVVPPGEDQTSYARHLKFLRAEEKKLHPSVQVVSILLYVTSVRY